MTTKSSARIARLTVAGLALGLLTVAPAYSADTVALADPGLANARKHVYDPDLAPVTLRAMEKFYRVATVHPGPGGRRPKRAPQALSGFSYVSQGRTWDDAALMTRTATNAMLVMKDGQIFYERYRNGADADSRFVIMSISKSVTSLLVGAAIAAGNIRSDSDQVVRYLPELRGSAYDGVTIAQVLQMRSGVVYDEDGNDAQRFNDLVLRQGGTIVGFAKTLGRRDPARPFNYSTFEACLLGVVVERATHRTLDQLTEDTLWRPGGMVDEAFWMVEQNSSPNPSGLGGGGLNATARDLARLGEIVADGGSIDGRRILPASWIARLTAPEAHPVVQDNHWIYRDQWWLDPETGAIVGRGYLGQLLYIDPRTHVVIVKFSYIPVDNKFLPIEDEMMDAFRAVDRKVAGR